MEQEDQGMHPDPAGVLAWFLEAGVDETIGDAPLDRYALSAAAKAKPVATAPAASTVASARRPQAAAKPEPTVPVSPRAADAPTATHSAQGAKTLAELKAALETFEGCALKKTAKSTVFSDGNPAGRLMVVGEAPGGDEDRQGLPFVGVSGKLLDRMLESIGFTRDNAYITNVVPWRPPGNRKPTPEEVGMCVPFLERHVELVDPEVLLLVGGLSAKTLLARSEGITRLRGTWYEVSSHGLSRPIPAMATFHPAYLLRSPQQKRLAWRDLLAVKEKLDSLAAS